jgi:hypothetical protein
MPAMPDSPGVFAGRGSAFGSAYSPGVGDGATRGACRNIPRHLSFESQGFWKPSVRRSPQRHWSKTLDVLMLAVTGGRKGTLTEYRDLLSAADIDLVGTTPTATPFSIVEGRT